MARRTTQMLISDVLKTKGHDVVMVRPTDRVALAVGKLAEHRIGAVLVEDQ
jgi:CBS domain-containing protein